MVIERRMSTPGTKSAWIETRSNGQKMIVGYAARFYDPKNYGTEYHLFENCVERLAPTAFDRAIREKQRVTCLYNHETDCLIGSTQAKSLRIKVDKLGLYYECDVPALTNPFDLVQRIESGRVAGSSFGFAVGPGSTRWETEGKKEVRWLVDLERLIDASPVDTPAYEATTTGIQIAGTVLSDDLKRKRDRQMVDVTMRLLELEDQERQDKLNAVNQVLARVNKRNRI